MESQSEVIGIPQNIFLSIGNIFSHALIVLGPAIPYIPQYIENKRTKHAAGFSLYVSLLVVFGACLKISYWCGRSYDIFLLLQNFAVISAVMVMLDQHIVIENNRLSRQFDDRNFVDFDVTWFWHWTNIISYFQATGYIVIMLTLLAIFLNWVPFIFDILAAAIVIFDSSVIVPQFFSNYWKQNTFGLNKAMVSLWIIWDAFKLLYVVSYPSPWLFKVTNGIQMLVAVGILGQIFYYGDHPTTAND